MRKERRVSQEEVADVLRAWAIGDVAEVSTDSLGTINQTWLVTAARGRYALRLSSHVDTDKLQREFDLMAYAVDKRIPAIQPVPASQGTPFLEREGLWTLSPFAPGAQVDRQEMLPKHDRGMGRGLAILLEALADCPHELAKTRHLSVDTERTLCEIDRFLELVRAYSNSSELEEHALMRLTARKKWIESHADDTPDGLADLPSQVIHGDYQDRNVFFDEAGDIVGLIDWDNAWVAPREWEIIRALNFVMFFDPERGRTFVEGYIERSDLNLDALDRAAQGYSIKRSHDLFLYEEIYERGNERSRQFLRPGGFSPPYQQWEPLRDTLKEIL